ncbi:glutamine amidotransferase [Iningainema tapete]|uniref:Glutamine amidotransferase n=1 Tax=Iningainema tapete BLCC-T55 TaxID=2748662 RepID=A0A8J6XB30_9CYAN|nr:glutamine amidotransferase [Iningainema tapete]MBD2771279.1 glutamine amidotransferase [Iningainema tapete BLCC-T55]
MCGVAGIVYRVPELYGNLGRDLLSLIQPLCSRGPDSCGVALYGNYNEAGIVGQVEVYKEVGGVESLTRKYELLGFSGTHGIGHTRMATESVVDTNHSHPFTASGDLSIVHNGQLSNYYRLRYQLERMGAVFVTNNDSEAIAHYIYYQLFQGKSLEAALKQLLNDVDGTYTFLVATPDKVALVRDRFAAKPAVVYESSNTIAIASEYRALLNLNNFDPTATIREPDAGEINIWSVVQITNVETRNFASLQDAL